MFYSDNLKKNKDIEHCFFSRKNGISKGIYKSLNCGVGSQDKKPKQVKNWLNLFNKNFGNAELDRVYIPSFDCNWNFASSINN